MLAPIAGFQDGSTDVSAAQSFDVGSFLNNLVSTTGGIVAARTMATQNNGQPSATQTPQLRVGLTGTASPIAGVSQQTLIMIGIGAAVVVGIFLLARK